MKPVQSPAKNLPPGWGEDELTKFPQAAYENQGRLCPAFRAASGLAMAGQAADIHPQCRAMLEDAAYAVHVHRDAAIGKVWLNRHQDAASLKASKKAFQHDAVVRSVTATNRQAAERFEKLYQHAIDFGGHPNERSVTGNMKMVKEPDQLTMLAVMQHGDGLEFDWALKFVAQCGMVSLELLQVIFDAKFELLGINAKMLALRRAGI